MLHLLGCCFFLALHTSSIAISLRQYTNRHHACCFDTISIVHFVFVIFAIIFVPPSFSSTFLAVSIVHSLVHTFYILSHSVSSVRLIPHHSSSFSFLHSPYLSHYTNTNIDTTTHTHAKSVIQKHVHSYVHTFVYTHMYSHMQTHNHVHM